MPKKFLIGTSCYELGKFPISEIEWFLTELVKAGGNATEFFPTATWNEMWRWQPYQIVRWETEMWKDKPWTPMPNYAYPVFDLNRWAEDTWKKWRQIFDLSKAMNITLMVRTQDFCSRKENFLERHWCYWSNVQSWRWGGPMSGGYVHWPPGDDGPNGKKYIWHHYDKFNARLISELNASGVKYYLTDWNELYWTPGSQEPPGAPVNDPKFYQYKIHEWFIENFKKNGCPANRILVNPERMGKENAETTWLAKKLRDLGVGLELHGCESPQAMTEIARIFGAGRHLYPNGDGTDPDAQGINDGRPGYTEPSLTQARAMGRMIKEKNLLGYLYKNRSMRHKKTLKRANFSAVVGLSDGIKNG